MTVDLLLQARPQFGVIENPLDITPDDFLAFLIGDFQRRGYTNIQLVNISDHDSQCNQ